MLLLGIDLGTSSIKVSVVDSSTQQCVAAAQYPDTENPVIAIQTGWAEQAPETWWEHIQQAILRVHASNKYNPLDIGAIGIAYQMHGMVVVDKHKNVLRNSIIWCDSRAVAIGERAFQTIGKEKCLSRLLNSPGNFTASKLAWVKENEPAIFDQIDKVMLPGDFVAMKLTGEINTNFSALSEGIFWDFEANDVSSDVLNYFGFSKNLIPSILPVFSNYGELTADVAAKLLLKTGIPVTYKAGDQPNNALSLNVLNPGEVAATAGTSGVIYGVSDELTYDPQSRVNPFAHVNYSCDKVRLGVLLCINGTGILNRWVKDKFNADSYAAMNHEAQKVAIGSNGLRILPFGNGAERVLNNQQIGAHFQNLDLNKHTRADIFRATQEGIAFAFRYGLDIMRSNGMHPSIIKAGMANMFQSELFTEAFVNATNTPVELYKNDGSVGAALGAGIGVKAFASAADAFTNMQAAKKVEPTQTDAYESAYQNWKELLNKQINNTEQEEILCHK
ncbi:FGGY family carbohydrate kinase [Solitalea sp. MAHUQ-68]|uniref:FGGY family carbohydrate kinase n=1 Tax=Solitalea agri TaxID=2953739 RepID=A0A9X2JCA5_9SPHI|nr:FGGY family carbohydrate kinase [Solitalea agri]MCO4291580.1 FGGY family carbohydrate kinase [Solitalea agri]